MFWVTLAAFLAVCVYTWFAGRQTSLIHDFNVETLRPFIYAQRLSAIIGIAPDMKTKVVAVIIPLANSGATPTSGLKLTVRCVEHGAELREPWVVFHQEEATHFPMVIPPRAPPVDTYCSFLASELPQIQDGTLHEYVMGDITYVDKLDPGIRHVTQFTYELVDVTHGTTTPTDGTAPVEFIHGKFETRGMHNCTDDDCPKD
jgi:hypothetical protein